MMVYHIFIYITFIKKGKFACFLAKSKKSANNRVWGLFAGIRGVYIKGFKRDVITLLFDFYATE